MAKHAQNARFPAGGVRPGGESIAWMEDPAGHQATRQFQLLYRFEIEVLFRPAAVLNPEKPQLSFQVM